MSPGLLYLRINKCNNNNVIFYKYLYNDVLINILTVTN